MKWIGKFEDAIQGVTQRLAPFLTHLLYQAAQTPLAQEKNKIKKPDKVCVFKAGRRSRPHRYTALQHRDRSTRPFLLIYELPIAIHLLSLPMDDRLPAPNHRFPRTVLLIPLVRLASQTYQRAWKKLYQACIDSL